MTYDSQRPAESDRVPVIFGVVPSGIGDNPAAGKLSESKKSTSLKEDLIIAVYAENNDQKEKIESSRKSVTYSFNMETFLPRCILDSIFDNKEFSA